jgi:hypothetical protein
MSNSPNALFDALGERAKEVARTGKALVIVAHGKALVLAWQAGDSLYEAMRQGGIKESFAPEDEGFDMGPAPSGDGIYVCDLGWVDDGPGDWPGSREVLPSIQAWRQATAEEWGRHLKNEWPWEPVEGWA